METLLLTYSIIAVILLLMLLLCMKIVYDWLIKEQPKPKPFNVVERISGKTIVYLDRQGNITGVTNLIDIGNDYKKSKQSGHFYCYAKENRLEPCDEQILGCCSSLQNNE